MEAGSALLLGLSLLLLLAARELFVRQVYRFLMLCLRRPKIVAFTFALLLFPGVLVHEISHWISAKLLLVATQGISLRPQITDRGTLRLGYVTIADGGFLRNAMIGFAPFAYGTLLVSWIALDKLMLGALYAGFVHLDFGLSMSALSDVGEIPNSVAWLYILLAVSATMLPSASDRSAWFPAVILLLCLVGLFSILWGNPFASDWGAIVGEAVNSISAAFILVAGLQSILAFSLFFVRWLIARLAKFSL